MTDDEVNRVLSEFPPVARGLVFRTFDRIVVHRPSPDAPWTIDLGCARPDGGLDRHGALLAQIVAANLRARALDFRPIGP